MEDGKLEGFSVDLIKEIARIGGFNYTLELAPNGSYEAVVNNINTIDGIIGEVHHEVRQIKIRLYSAQ